MNKILLIFAFGLLAFACNNKVNYKQDKASEMKPYLYKEGKYFTQSGLCFREVFFLDDQTKKVIDYNKMGKTARTMYFKNDLQDGKTTIFYETGEVKEVQYYENGVRTRGDTTFYKNGSPHNVWTFENNLKNGPMMIFDSTGKIIKSLVFKDDEIIEADGNAVNRIVRDSGQIFLGKFDRKSNAAKEQ